MTDSAFSETFQVRFMGMPVEVTISAYALNPTRLKISAAMGGRSSSVEIRRIDALRLAECVRDLTAS